MTTKIALVNGGSRGLGKEMTLATKGTLLLPKLPETLPVWSPVKYFVGYYNTKRQLRLQVVKFSGHESFLSSALAFYLSKQRYHFFISR